MEMQSLSLDSLVDNLDKIPAFFSEIDLNNSPTKSFTGE
jgi:hypothetical protein